MKRQRRTHSQEFKQEAVALVVEHGYSYAAAGRSLGVNGALIGRWQRQLEGHAADAFPAYGPTGLIFVLATEGNPRHKRSPLIPLTSKRRALFRKIRERDMKIVKQMLSHVSETDRRVTQKNLETLLAQLK